MAEVYTENVGQRKDDVDWIPEIAGRGLPILSKDNGLKSDPERQAIIDSAARVFLLPDTQRPAVEQTARFVYHRYRIALRCHRDGPYIYLLFPKKLEHFPLG